MLDEVNQSLTDSGWRELFRANPSMSLKLSLFRFLGEAPVPIEFRVGTSMEKPLWKRSRTRTARDAMEVSH
jgi:hypothetical protein